MRARVLALVVWAGLAASTAAVPSTPQSSSAMVVPLRDAPFAQLVDAGSSVAFDFTGTGEASRRGWLTTDAAWLVWDPEWRGRVRAGSDMMGQRTWSVVWRDGFAGDTAQGARKPATTETGLVVQVPLFVNEGDTIRVDTRTGEYQTRL